jgi:hypothetical protein
VGWGVLIRSREKLAEQSIQASCAYESCGKWSYTLEKKEFIVSKLLWGSQEDGDQFKSCFVFEN